MDEKTYDLYERYYHSELSEAEQTIFKKKLEKEAGFKEGYIAFRKAIRLVKNAGPKPADKELAAIRAKYEKQALAVKPTNFAKIQSLNGDTVPISNADTPAKVVPLKRPWIRRILAIAASVGILVMANFWYESTKINAYNAGKIAGMVEAYEQININRANAYLEGLVHGSTPSVTDKHLSIFNNGMDRYSKKRYGGAIKYFKSYLEKQPKTKINATNFYLGESLRLEGYSNEALIYLNQIKDESDYYASKYNSLAIIFDKSASVENAAEAFKKVKESDDKELAEQVKAIFAKNKE